MEKPQNESSKSLTNFKGCTAIAQDVNWRLLQIERILDLHDSRYNAFNPVLIRSINNCMSLQQQRRKFLTHCEESLLPFIRKMETKLAAFRSDVIEMENRILLIDLRRRPNAKLNQIRRNLVNIVIKLRGIIEDYEAILASKVAAVVEATDNLKLLKEDTIHVESLGFQIIHFFKHERHRLTTRRTQLLAIKQALQDED